MSSHNGYAVVGDAKRDTALDMTAKDSENCRKVSTDLAKEPPKKLMNLIQSLRPAHQTSLQKWMPEAQQKEYFFEVFSMPRNLNWEVMKRVRKAMDRNRPGCLIDFHSGNEFVYRDLRISPANKYMEHLPYINSLWFGEMYDYNESPDYWLVEISGIPFGLFGEMLQDNGNPWRGMLYGMTARYYQGAAPKHIWKVWDDFVIQDAEMIGYWVPSCPVKTDQEGILATVYVKKRKALISIASWAKQPLNCRLKIDWNALGMNAQTARLSAPSIPGFQSEAQLSPAAEIPMEPGRGWLLLLEDKPS